MKTVVLVMIYPMQLFFFMYGQKRETMTSGQHSTTLVFTIPVHDTLNSNRMPRNTFVKSKTALRLRQLGAREGIVHHRERDAAQQKYDLLMAERDVIQRKANLVKKMRKKKMPDTEIQSAVTTLDAEHHKLVPSSSIVVPYMFTTFTVDVEVSSYNKAIFDPPNFYPTVKPIIDGLTDTSWWADDNFHYLTAMTFTAGEPRRELNKEYMFTMTFTENS